MSEEVADPGEALLERSVQRGTGEPYERRVTTEGDVLERSSTNARFTNGEWQFDSQPWVWRRLTRLAPDELATVRDALEASGFFDLDPVHRPRESSIGGSDVTWTANLDGRSHQVALLGVPDVKVAAIETLQTAVEDAIAAALHRAGQSA